MDNTALVSNIDCPSDRSSHSASFRLKKVFPTIQTSQTQPLFPKLQLLLVIISGNPSHSSVFQEKLKKPSSQSGNLKLPQNTNLSLTDGNFFEY